MFSLPPALCVDLMSRLSSTPCRTPKIVEALTAPFSVRCLAQCQFTRNNSIPGVTGFGAAPGERDRGHCHAFRDEPDARTQACGPYFPIMCRRPKMAALAPRCAQATMPLAAIAMHRAHHRWTPEESS